MSNSESLPQLKTAQKIASKPAYLQIAGQDRGFYAFNYNPEEFTDNLSAGYTSVSALSSEIPYLDYSNGSGTTRKFSNLLMDTYSNNLSLRVIIDGIKDLMKAHPERAEYEPPNIEFHWGSDSFKPCKLVDFSYTITHFLGGEPAKGTADLTLTLVPDDRVIVPTLETETQRAIVASTTTITTLPVNLTARQIGEGEKAAIKDLEKHLSKVGATVRNAFKTNRYKVKTDSTGNIIFCDSAGKELLNLGTYNGLLFVSNLVRI